MPNPLGYVDPLGLAICPVMYDWYKYNRSQGMTAAQAHQAIKNTSPQDVLNYALHRQGLSGHNYPIKFKEKFTVGNYKYEVRAHDVNPTAPAGVILPMAPYIGLVEAKVEQILRLIKAMVGSMVLLMAVGIIHLI